VTLADLAALLDDGALATLHVRRGVEQRDGNKLVQGYTVQLHLYAEHVGNPEVGIVQHGTHVLARGASLAAALQALLDKLARPA
jgi:hypothetical protein